ncbi:MAG: DegT/DnrJ/EryC1/StrS family aminotransferase [Balneolales bacterium]|nr:DegT/DnrJ/EryC1/StrS family aminotransferase [Balneolales bacterium]
MGQFEGRKIFYANAAHAFYDVMVGLQQFRPKQKPNIIMPVYIPAKLYRFVLAAGYEPKFYDVPTDLNLNLQEISELIDDQTQAVFAVHFFGIPVDMEPLKEITAKAGVYLIEDCAHIMNAKYKGKILGTTGDFTLFSTRKMMQFHFGGILVLNSEPWKFKPSQKKRVNSLFFAYHLLGSRIKFRVNNAMSRYNLTRKLSLPGTGYINFSEKHVVHVKMMDHLSEWYCKLIDLDKLVNKRRDNFLFLLNTIEDHTFVQPLGLDRYATKDTTNRYSLNKGFAPFSMPVLIPDGSRDKVQKALCDAGVICFIGWPEAPFEEKGFEGAEALQNGLIELPVHKYMDSNQLKKIVDCLNTLPENVKRPHHVNTSEPIFHLT